MKSILGRVWIGLHQTYASASYGTWSNLSKIACKIIFEVNKITTYQQKTLPKSAFQTMHQMIKDVSEIKLWADSQV